MNAQLAPMDNGLSPLRVGRITGSRIAAVLGLNPYSKPGDVLREMVREFAGAPREFTGNDATRHGQAHEPDALALYEARFGIMCHGGGDLIIHPKHDFLAVTPDGLVGDDGIVECKAPYRGTYSTIAELPYYLPQVQLQLACTGRAWCDFVVWRDGTIAIDRVPHDPHWLTFALPDLREFIAMYHEAIESPEILSIYTADRDRKDAEWRTAASRYRAAKLALDTAQEDETSARAALLALAPDGAKGCGVTLTRTERSGSVDYAKALKAIAPDTDLEPYRKAGGVVYSIRTSS